MLPILKLPSSGEDITIKILEHPIPDPRKRHRDFGEYVIKCCIYGNENECYYLEFRPFIKKELIKECQNNNIPIDKDLNCSIGRVFTIFAKRWTEAPKRMWYKDEITCKLEPPMVHRLKLIKTKEK